MKVSAIHRNARMAPQKIRLVGRLLVGSKSSQAEAVLINMPGKASAILLKVLHSAVANAVNNFNLEKDHLVVQSVYVNEGLRMKRIRPVSRGMSHPYVRRSSHVAIVIEGLGEAPRHKKKAEIKTVSLQEHVDSGRRGAHVSRKDNEKSMHAKRPQHQSAEKDEKTSTPGFQKTKMFQQGGNRKKTFRRKSV